MDRQGLERIAADTNRPESERLAARRMLEGQAGDTPAPTVAEAESAKRTGSPLESEVVAKVRATSLGEVPADDAFAFCCEKGWSDAALELWDRWREATKEASARALLGLPDERPTDKLVLLSDTAVADYCTAQGWSGQQREEFDNRLVKGAAFYWRR